MQNSDQNVLDQSILDVFSGKSVENPFPIFAKMRSMGAVIPITSPIGGIDGQTWMVTRMEEAMQVLKDHAHFTVDGGLHRW
ncbi:hypothetical protein RCO48_20055 [Peribacillus frigoritolerans]|nr:hypothetical protein [Peribacillus frigoritolerans]